MECFEDESKELPRPDLHATAPVKGCYPDLAAHDLAELELKMFLLAAVNLRLSATNIVDIANRGMQYNGSARTRSSITSSSELGYHLHKV